MSKKSNLINLLWTLLAIAAVGVVLLGGYVTWRFVHTTTAPTIETAKADRDQLLERAATARQEEENKNVEGKGENAEEAANEDTASDADSAEEYADEEEDVCYEDEEDCYEEEVDETEGESAPKEDPVGQKEQYSYTLEDVSTPQKPTRPAASSKPAPARNSKPKELFATYAKGLALCRQGRTFPGGWKDVSGGALVKQYWLRNRQGPVERIVYNKANGQIISQTFSTLDGAVLRYQGDYAELYFENGLLTKVRTFPYDNPNLRDWFLIGKDGQISACLCGVPTKDCCARSFLYKPGGPRRYCALFPMDADFCVKSRA